MIFCSTFAPVKIRRAEVAQLVRAPDCGSGGHGFKSLPRYGFFIMNFRNGRYYKMSSVSFFYPFVVNNNLLFENYL